MIDGEGEQFGKSNFVETRDSDDEIAMYARHVPGTLFSLGFSIEWNSTDGSSI